MWTLPWTQFALDAMRFSRMFWKIIVWMQSATDDPEICFSSFHMTLDSPPMKGLINAGLGTANV